VPHWHAPWRRLRRKRDRNRILLAAAAVVVFCGFVWAAARFLRHGPQEALVHLSGPLAVRVQP
jgi:hypothetical protein